MAIITISRQMGAGGNSIATKVAEELGYELVDYGLIKKAAELSDVSLEYALEHDEKYESLAFTWLKKIINPSIGKIIIEDKRKGEQLSFIEQLRKVIFEIAAKDRVVIVGRGAQFILKDLENVFSINIIADFDYRVERIMKILYISKIEATEKVKESDNERKAYIQKYFNVDKDNPYYYDMLINTTRLDEKEAILDIVDAARRFGTIREYIPGIKDRRVLHDRRKGSRRKGPRRQDSYIWPSSDVRQTIMRGRPSRSSSGTDRRVLDRRNHVRRKEDMVK